MNSTAVENSATINGLDLHWLEWGPSDGEPVLALHGWLDNAASFSVLSPLLKNCRVVAIDLPGHGLSGHRKPPGSYNIWDDLLDILALVDHLGWQEFNCLGHSRGAIIGLLLAVTQADRVQRYIALDGIVAQALAATEAPSQLARYLRDQRRSRKPAAKYSSIEQAIQTRIKAGDISVIAAEPIVERGLQLVSTGVWQWRSDSRLRLASAFKMSSEHNLAFVQQLAVPSLLLLANQGIGKHPEVLTIAEMASNLSISHLDGSHHFHMESQAPDIAQLIEEFLLESAY
ncbi:MAG: alpha/beta hydrolase [Pseudomonadales bacterium]